MKRGFILEDLPDSQAWLHAVLEEAFPSIVVETASTIASAQEQLLHCIPDVALLDLGLPDGSGLEVIRLLNAIAPQSVCVVATIFDDDQHLFPALRAGAQGYLLKDRPREELVVALRGIVSGHPPLSPGIARRLLGFFQPEPTWDSPLTPRETEVLTLIAKGYSIARVAELLTISRNTASGYVKDIYRKLNVSNRAEATLEAARRGMVKP